MPLQFKDSVDRPTTKRDEVANIFTKRGGGGAGRKTHSDLAQLL